MDLDKIKAVVDLSIKIEIHGILLLLVGAWMACHGMHDEGMVTLGAAAGVFKGKLS